LVRSFESRSGKLKIQLKLCRRRDIHEGFFRRQSGIDLIYERTTVCECGLSLEFLEHDCTFIQQGPVGPTQRLDATDFFGRTRVELTRRFLVIPAANS
jgi:hypothetical protein